jgi:hypothetical protein
VPSLLSRYTAGEHEQVWAEIRRLGPVPAGRAAEVDEVAAETMRRVGRHVRRLVAALLELGFVPDQADLPIAQPPTAADLADLADLAAEAGPLPAALRACLAEVGAVALTGDCPAVGLRYHQPPGPAPGMPPGPAFPDPLVLLGAGALLAEWRDEQESGEPTGLVLFAPDELHKAGFSGGSHDLALPDGHADPVLHNVAGRPGITLVEYLRVSIGWGGLPGYSFAPAAAPPALEPLRRSPDF